MPASMAGLHGERAGSEWLERDRYARLARRRPCHVAGGVCGEKGATPLGFPLIGKASAAADHDKAREALRFSFDKRCVSIEVCR